MTDLSEGHLLRLYFGVFQPSVVSSNILNAVAQRPYEHSPWQCLRGCQGFHVTWIMVMNIHISTTGSSTSTCDRRAVEQPVCEDDKIYVQHQLCVSGRQALCASRWLMTGLHCGTIVHIIGDEPTWLWKEQSTQAIKSKWLTWGLWNIDVLQQ